MKIFYKRILLSFLDKKASKILSSDMELAMSLFKFNMAIFDSLAWLILLRSLDLLSFNFENCLSACAVNMMAVCEICMDFRIEGKFSIIFRG